MNLLKNINFKHKITLLVMPALFGLMLLGVVKIINDSRSYRDTDALNQLIQLSTLNSALVHELQKERGASAGFISDHGNTFASLLSSQRLNTDIVLEQHRQYLQQIMAPLAGESLHRQLNQIANQLSQLPHYRQQIDQLTLSSHQIVSYFTDINSNLIDVIRHLSQRTDNASIASLLQAYFNFQQGKEHAGLERAMLSKVFTKGQFVPGEYRQFIRLVTQQSVYLDAFNAFAGQSLQDFYRQKMAIDAVGEVEKFRQQATQLATTSLKETHNQYDSLGWFAISTQRINRFKLVEDQIVEELLITAHSQSRQAMVSLVFTSAGVVAITLLSILLAVSVARLLTRQLQHIVTTIRQADQYGDLSVRAKIITTDEMGDIALQLNKMLGALSTAMEKIDDNNSHLKLAQAFFDTTSECVLISDRNNQILSVNNAFEKTTGYCQSELRGKSPSLLASGRHDKAFYQQMWQQLSDKGYWNGEIWNRRKNGEIYPEELSLNIVTDANGELTNYIAVFRDIGQWKKAEEQLAFYAYNDQLTKLPNRYNFVSKVQQQIATAERYQQPFSILFVDIDRFKTINDIYGHDIGDKLLINIASRLKQTVRNEDVVSRYGGDEFTLLLMKASAGSNTETVANKIHQALEQPFYIDEVEVNITSSIGVSLYPDNGLECGSLLTHADHAVHKMKQQGRNGVYYYDDSLQFEYQNKLLLKEKLSKAIVADALTVHYQPIVDITTGQIVKFEALLRWIDSDGQAISPAVFIPIAEEYNLIKPLGQWVLNQACADLNTLHQQGFEHIAFSVNRSVKEFINYHDQQLSIEQTVNRHGLPAKAIIIEVTESTAMQDSSDIQDILQELKECGIKIALDDFGTGYSSLSSLIDFHADIIKIDRSFIKEISNNYQSQSLTSLVIQLANSLGMEIVAEGVETSEQLEILQGYGCRQIQGYYFSPAQPLSQCLELLQEQPFNAHVTT